MELRVVMMRYFHFCFPWKLSAGVVLLSLSLISGFSSIIVGQRLLSLENRAITLSHCRRLNLQNIFLLNQNLQGQLNISSGQYSIVRLPNYCDNALSPAAQAGLKAIYRDTANPLATQEVIKLYADSLAAIENQDSLLKRNLLSALIGFNVFALVLEAISLYRENKEIQANEVSEMLKRD